MGVAGSADAHRGQSGLPAFLKHVPGAHSDRGRLSNLVRPALPFQPLPLGQHVVGRVPGSRRDDAVVGTYGRRNELRRPYRCQSTCLTFSGASVSARLTEANVENLAIDWFRSLGYDCALGSEISPGGARPLREAVTEPALAV